MEPIVLTILPDDSDWDSDEDNDDDIDEVILIKNLFY